MFMLESVSQHPNNDEKKIIENIVVKYIEENIDQLIIDSKVKRRRIDMKTRPNYWDSGWGRLLQDPKLEDPDSYVSKKFRRRFRTPYTLFKDVIVVQCKLAEVFGKSKNFSIPYELKILISLRILGRDAVSDDCEELSFVSERQCRRIFGQFVTNYALHFYNEYVKIPEGIELQSVMESYRKLGLPGCFGSMDVTHVQWEKCWDELKFKAYDKDGVKSLAFQSVVTHNRMCIHVSVAFLGGYNDVTISRNDTFVQNLVAGSMQNVCYVLYDDEGVPKLCKGAYLLTDNGYLKQGVYTCPWKQASNRQELLWSEWMESVRKDVECFFRAIKSRFNFFRNGILYTSPELIQNAFKTAAILHNMLLAYDGLWTECENSTSNFWDNLNPDTDEIIVLNENYSSFIDLTTEIIEPMESNVNFNSVIDTFQLQRNKNKFLLGKCFNIDDFYNLRSALVTHFCHQYKIGDLWWPRSMSKNQRQILILNKIQTRFGDECLKFLYHRESDYRCLDKDGENYTSHIGHGLFSKIIIKKDEIIGYFSGELINNNTRLRRDRLGRGGYTLHISNSVLLDCYNTFKAGNCIMAYANSPLQLKHKDDKAKNVTSNAYLSSNTTTGKVCLKAKRKIEAHEEILFSYHKHYQFPEPEF
jgi:hypothetical protein